MPELESAPDRDNRTDRRPRPKKPNYIARRLTATLVALGIAAPINAEVGNPIGKLVGSAERASSGENSAKQTLENNLAQGDEANALNASLRLNANQIQLRTQPSSPEDNMEPNNSSVSGEVQLNKPAIMHEGDDADGTSYIEIGGFVDGTAVFAEINQTTLPAIQVKLDGTLAWAPAPRDMSDFLNKVPEITGTITATHFDGDSPSVTLQTGDGTTVDGVASGFWAG